MMRLRARIERNREGGFTLVEMLIASSAMIALMAFASGTVVSIDRGASRARAEHDLNEEGRNALNRMARELRQAKALTYAVNPDGTTFSNAGLVALSFKVDFNGDGCAGNSPACSGTNNTTNPENLTYCYDPAGPAAERTYLWLIPSAITAAPTSCHIPGALPILAGNVKQFRVEYRSNQYRFDLDPTDGVTTWQELDAAGPPVGDAAGPDGDINTNAITSVNAVVLHLSMSLRGLTQDYVTQVDLRNRP